MQSDRQVVLFSTTNAQLCALSQPARSNPFPSCCPDTPPMLPQASIDHLRFSRTAWRSGFQTPETSCHLSIANRFWDRLHPLLFPPQSAIDRVENWLGRPCGIAPKPAQAATENSKRGRAAPNQSVHLFSQPFCNVDLRPCVSPVEAVAMEGTFYEKRDSVQNRKFHPRRAPYRVANTSRVEPRLNLGKTLRLLLELFKSSN